MSSHRTLYLDCHSGISGDMFVGALIDVGVPFEVVREAIRSLPIQNVDVSIRTVSRCGFAATKFDVAAPEQHAHRHLSDIVELVGQSSLTAQQTQLVEAIFTRIAQAEARVHGSSLKKVHFHEVGAVDSIVDIVAAAVAITWLGIEECIGSGVSVGCGSITIAHGEVSLPAPASAELLRGAPIVQTEIPHELTTPTGAAIVTELCRSFGPMPSMTLEAIGYGAGSRDLTQRANILRVLIGSTGRSTRGEAEQVVILETNLDDATGELIGHCVDTLLEAGALDAFLTPILMKKGRPGTMLSALCREADVSRLQEMIFLETGTLGIRCHRVDRTALSREQVQVETPWGIVEGKLAQLPNGRRRFAPEFDSCRHLSQQTSQPLTEIYRAAQRAAEVAWPEVDAS